ncbi:MAG: iron-containing alcohol dehydrogenase [Clostridiales Family XIII bacterium]|jgi:alcohol dehydrogenase YqhD (iron-dependent ADH family)|nr:iron-containing alcohol dehydrogenase [Clostridiales Family XIII bacterium]
MKTFSNFKFHMYTEIVFGKDTEAQTAALIRKYGGSKVLLVYGSGSIKKSGLYDRVTATLKEGGIPFAELGGVKSNPTRSLVEEGIRIAEAEGVDFFLGVGGGSTIDTAKAIALAVANGGEYWPFYYDTEPAQMAPVGTINTIAAAGSETSGSTVLVDDIETGFKRGLTWDVCRPMFAIMNPELTYSVPAFQTGAGASDIFAHTYMRYFNGFASYLGDQYCVATLRTVVKYAALAIAKPADYEARAELMLSAAFAHNDLTGIGRGSGPKGGEHPLEHQLSGYYDTAHGAGLAVIMPAYIRYMAAHGTAEQVARAAQFGVDVFDVEPDMRDVRGTALAAAAALTAWLRSIGMPTTLKELGVPKDELDAAIERIVRDTGGLIRGFMELDAAAIAEIYHSAAE